MISTDRGNWECPTVKALLLACALATLPALRTVVIDAAIAAVGFLISTTQPARSRLGRNPHSPSKAKTQAT